MDGPLTRDEVTDLRQAKDAATYWRALAQLAESHEVLRNTLALVLKCGHVVDGRRHQVRLTSGAVEPCRCWIAGLRAAGMVVPTHRG